MQALYLLGVTLLIFILLFVLRSFTKEGFDDDRMHQDFSDKYQEKYNNVGAALIATKHIGAIGSDTRNLFGNVKTTVDDGNNVVDMIDNPYPLEYKETGLFALIAKCEAVKVGDCGAFDDPSFNKDCGVCLDIGTNSTGSPATGGLVLTDDDKTYYRGKPGPRGGGVREYEPTVGTCPAKRMVSNKAECLRVQAEIQCEKNTTFNSPNGCSQCYNSDGNYLLLDSESRSAAAGTFYIIGSGKFVLQDIRRTLSQTRPLVITISNTEGWAGLTITLEGIPAPEEFDYSKTYSIGDTVIFRTGIYRMREGAGSPGYDPAREGDRLWELKGAVSEYDFPPPPFIAGYLASPEATGSTDTGYFNIDFFRLVLNDAETGRKPRVTKTITLNGIDVTKMEAGYRKTRMTLVIRHPFVFADQMSEESKVCVTSPFVTRSAAAEFLQSDPCYAKGSKPGNYNVECIQSSFLANGCTEQGKGYPKTIADATKMAFNGATPLKLSEVADNIYAMAVLSATGINSNGNKVPIEQWSETSVFCTGKAITSPCDIPEKESGPLSKDCITYLWDNQGQNKELGATYGSSLWPNAWSLFDTGKVQRFCTRSGLLSPKNANGTDNVVNMKFWSRKGGVAAVKAAMSLVHTTANNPGPPEDPEKALAIKQCYGIQPNSRPTGSTSYVSDDSEADNIVIPSGPPRNKPNPMISAPIDISQGRIRFANGDVSGPIVYGQQIMNWSNFTVSITINRKPGSGWGGSFFNPTPYASGIGHNYWGNINLNSGVWYDLQHRVFYCMISGGSGKLNIFMNEHSWNTKSPSINTKRWESNVITGGGPLHMDMSLSNGTMRVKLSGALEQTAEIPNVAFHIPTVDTQWNWGSKPAIGPINSTIFAAAFGNRDHFNGTINYLHIGSPEDDTVSVAANPGAVTASGSSRVGGPGWNM